MAPALILLVPFGLVLAWLVLFGMHRSINDWLVPFLTGLLHPHGSFLTRAALKPFSVSARGVLWLVNRVDHAITKAASHSTAAIAHWLNGLTSWVTHLFNAAESFALDVEHAFGRIVHHTIPHAIHAAVAPVAHTARLGLREAEQVAHRLRVYARGIDRLLHDRILPGIRALERTVEVTIPRALGRIRTRVRALEHDLTHPSRAWLKRLARSMWAVALFGLVIRTLARRFPWLFCRKTKTVGGRLCGLDQGLLNALLLDTLILSGTISVVAFARELQAIEGAALAIMREGIDEL